MLRIVLGSALLLLAPTHFPSPPVPASCCSEEGATPATDRLDIIRRMAGTWVALDEQDRPTDRVVSKMSVTSGGNAVLEILFPGTSKEMVSVYSIDGDQVVIDHFCLMGNQPRFAGKVSDDGKTIDWNCIGGGNLKDHARAHMHHGVTRLLGADRIDSIWTATRDGATIMNETFRLIRAAAGEK